MVKLTPLSWERRPWFLYRHVVVTISVPIHQGFSIKTASPVDTLLDLNGNFQFLPLLAPSGECRASAAGTGILLIPPHPPLPSRSAGGWIHRAICVNSSARCTRIDEVATLNLKPPRPCLSNLSLDVPETLVILQLLVEQWNQDIVKFARCDRFQGILGMN